MTNQNRNYPTRMHEVLGVETNKVYTWRSLGEFSFFVNQMGEAHNLNGDMLNAVQITALVLNPECIIRKPRLSEYAIDILKALKTLGYEWVRMDNQFCMWAYNSHPYRENWDKKTLIFGTCYDEVLPILKHKEPLDIVATLKAAGVEVE